MVIGIPPRPVVFGAQSMEGMTEDGERMVHVVMEQPETIRGFGEPVEKATLERMHLEEYRFDVIMQSSAVPFNGVEEGADPPDFVVEAPEAKEAWDCAAFAFEKRRMSRCLFNRLSQRQEETAVDRNFLGIASTSVSVWFGRPTIR